MAMALREAAKGVGHTSPNPAVGAVLVRSGKVIGRGFHKGAGCPHAEIEALKSVRGRVRGATLYVTLEPCSTHGRTPPCVDAVIEAGVARVVIGAIDPNPKHAGRAVALLEKAGIEVKTGVLSAQCEALNREFNKWITTGMPYVYAKAGMSLDGRISRAPGEPQWITSSASRSHAHRLRARVDAILVGAETLRRDNPRLTVRGIPGAKQPWRVVLTKSGQLPADAHLFTDKFRDKTLVFKDRTLRSVLRELGRREITSVLIEGGMRVLGQAFDQQLVDAVEFYVAPMFLGGPTVAVGGRGVGTVIEAPRIRNPLYERIGDDLHLSGEVAKVLRS